MVRYQDLNVSRIAHDLQCFADDRDWQHFHTPKNLAIALSVEASELLEIFQWMTPEESQLEQLSDATRQNIEEEIADVLIYLVRLSDQLQMDLQSAYEWKIRANADKYPVETTRKREVPLGDVSDFADESHREEN